MTVPRKILFVIDYFKDSNSGTEGQLLQLIANIDRRQFSPLLLVFQPSHYLSKHGFPCPYTVLGVSSLTNPVMWWQLFLYAQTVRREGVELAHVYFNDASVICPPVFAFAGIKTIISRRDMGYWYDSLYKILLRVTGRFVAAVVVNSHAVAQVTEAVEHIPEHKFTGSNNRISPSKFSIREQKNLKSFQASRFDFALHSAPMRN